MRILLLLMTIAWTATATDDGWDKVAKLTSGTEVRIFKRAAAKPIIARLDEANQENLIVVVKNEQVAIPRQEVDRVDYRPTNKGSRVTSQTKTTREPESAAPSQVNRPGSTSTSSNVTIGGKPDFETIYRRRTGAPK